MFECRISTSSMWEHFFKKTDDLHISNLALTQVIQGNTNKTTQGEQENKKTINI